MIKLDTRQTFTLLASFGAVLIISAFILQHGFGVLPCKMCWWQRYAHWVIFGASLLGVLLPAPKFQRGLLGIITFAAAGGLAVALWQFAAQHQWLPYPATCTSEAAQALVGAADLMAAMNNQPPVTCDKESFTLLGLSLAGWNIPAMLLVLALAYRQLKQPQ